MKEFLTSGQVGNIELEQQRKLRQTIEERWDKLARSIQTVSKDVENVTVTSDKISKKFEMINRVDVEKIGEKVEQRTT